MHILGHGEGNDCGTAVGQSQFFSKPDFYWADTPVPGLTFLRRRESSFIHGTEVNMPGLAVHLHFDPDRR
jgi:hypothetical protein